MVRPNPQQTKIRVAITGAAGALGKVLLPRLERSERVERVLVLDVAKPDSGARVEYRRVDLIEHDAERDVRQALDEFKADVLYHMAFSTGRRQHPALAHELEVAGTMRVLAALAQGPVRRLIVPSVTAVYGASGRRPALLGEDAPLATAPHSRFLRDKVEVEQQIRSFRAQHPEVQVLVLRLAPVLGPQMDNPATRFLSSPVTPTLLGFDPLWQALHQEDAGTALLLALTAETSGEFNVVGDGVLPLSALIRQAGGRPMPLPSSLARGILTLLRASGTRALSPALLDFARFSWVADGRKARHALGFAPRHHTREAAAALRGS